RGICPGRPPASGIAAPIGPTGADRSRGRFHRRQPSRRADSLFQAPRTPAEENMKRHSSTLLGAVLAGLLLSHTGWAAEVKPKNVQALKGLTVIAEIKGDSEEDGRVVLRLSNDLILTMHVEGAAVPTEPVQTILTSQDWRVLKRSPSKAEPLGP